MKTETRESGTATRSNERSPLEEKVVVMAHIRARKGYEAIVRDTLKRLVTPSLAEAGCLQYSLHESLNDSTLFVLHQIWASEKHFKAHGESAHIAGFRRTAPTILDGPIAQTKWKVLA